MARALFLFVALASSVSAAEPTLYELLDVAQDATTQQIRSAYRKKALELHPDKSAGAQRWADTTEKFIKVSEAYETLRCAVPHGPLPLTQSLDLPASTRGQQQLVHSNRQNPGRGFDVGTIGVATAPLRPLPLILSIPVPRTATSESGENTTPSSKPASGLDSAGALAAVAGRRCRPRRASHSSSR